MMAFPDDWSDFPSTDSTSQAGGSGEESNDRSGILAITELADHRDRYEDSGHGSIDLTPVHTGLLTVDGGCFAQCTENEWNQFIPLHPDKRWYNQLTSSQIEECQVRTGRQRNPWHPNFGSLEARRSSFPSRVILDGVEMDGKKLAEAGFFYERTHQGFTAVKDKVQFENGAIQHRFQSGFSATTFVSQQEKILAFRHRDIYRIPIGNLLMNGYASSRYQVGDRLPKILYQPETYQLMDRFLVGIRLYKEVMYCIPRMIWNEDHIGPVSNSILPPQLS